MDAAITTHQRETGSTMAVDVYERVAEGFTVGLDALEERGDPLTQRQRIMLLRSLFQALDGMAEYLAFFLAFDDRLADAIRQGEQRQAGAA